MQTQIRTSASFVSIPANRNNATTQQIPRRTSLAFIYAGCQVRYHHVFKDSFKYPDAIKDECMQRLSISILAKSKRQRKFETWDQEISNPIHFLKSRILLCVICRIHFFSLMINRWGLSNHDKYGKLAIQTVWKWLWFHIHEFDDACIYRSMSGS